MENYLEENHVLQSSVSFCDPGIYYLGYNTHLLQQLLKNKQHAAGLNDFTVNGSVWQTVTECGRKTP